MAATKRRPSWLKLGVGLACLLPAADLARRYFTDALGANPIERVLNALGWWALVFLLVTLACTPAQWLTGRAWPARLRRLFGLVAFFYACLHLVTYVWLDQGLAWALLVEDVVKRKFMTAGLLALVLMAPLAATSTSRMVKRLGYPRWKRLHRLVYVAAVAGVIHFFWRVKADLREPAIFAAALGLLFALRIVARVRAHATSGAAPADGSCSSS